MTVCNQIRPHLSAYVDHALDAALAGDVRVHLLTCVACRGVADDLGRIRDEAGRLGPIAPPPHIWLEVMGRVRLEALVPDTARARPVRGVTKSDTWQWLGLAAALIMVTLGVYAIARPDPQGTHTTIAADAGNATDVPTVETVEETMRRAEAEYEKAIAQLEQVVNSGDSTVSAASVDTLQRSLTTIDSAIAESRAALNSSPDSQPARTSLFEALRSKVNLLQQTVVLMNEMRKGDASGAAEAAAGFGKGAV